MTFSSIHVRVLAAAILSASPAVFGQAVPLIEDIAGTAISSRPGPEFPLVPFGIAVAPDGRVYINDTGSSPDRIRRFDPVTGLVNTVPGTPGNSDLLMDARSIAFHPLTGDAYVATFNSVFRVDFSTGTRVQLPEGAPQSLGSLIGQIAFDSAGNLYVPDEAAHRVRVVNQFGVQTFAGTGTSGFNGDNRTATTAQLNAPAAVIVDAAGNVYIADQYNNRVRKVAAGTGIITTVLGTGSIGFNGDGLPGEQTNTGLPASLAIADNSLIVGERANARVLSLPLAGGLVSRIAGTGVYGFSGDGGAAASATLTEVNGIAADAAGDLYLSDTLNKRVRRIDAATGVIDTVAGNGWNAHCGDGGPALDACFHGTTSLAMDAAGDVYVGETWTGRVRKISLANGLVSTVFGVDYDSGYGGVGGPATAASLGGQVSAVAFDPSGNLHIAGSDANRVGRVDALTGTFTLFAGNGNRAFTGDGGLATLATLNRPYHIVFDAAGNAYISDSGNHRIRKVAASTGIITTFAGNGATGGPLGDSGPATSASLSNPGSLVFDAVGNLLIADQGHCRIRAVNMTTRVITTWGGNGLCHQGPVDPPVSITPIGQVLELARSPAGQIFIATPGDIRKVDTAGFVHQVVNNGAPLDNPSGRPVEEPYGMVFDATGRLYLTTFVPDGVRRISNLDAPAADTTPPIIVPGMTGTLGNDLWFRSNVTLSWSVLDQESVVTSTSGCANSTVTTDTAGVTFTCTATSAGGTATQSVTIKRDTAPPVVTFGAPSPAANAAFWNNTDVSVPFTVGDALSGVASGSSSPVVVTGEGIGLGNPVLASDVAGNSVSAALPFIAIDRTPPLVSVTTPAAGATYGAFATVNAQYSCSDPNLQSCTGTVASGAALPTNSAGAKSFTVTSADFAGNVSTIGRSYSIAALQFERFIEPLRRSPTYNGVTAGSLVPIRWRMLDGTGVAVTNPAAFQSFTALNLGCQGTAVPLNDPATGGAGLSVNPANGYFTYNWQTDASWAGTCRRVQIRLGDNSVKEVVFRLN